jgi:hypothetical protein
MSYKYLLYFLILINYINSQNIRKLCGTDEECSQVKKNVIITVLILFFTFLIIIIFIVIYIKVFYLPNKYFKEKKDLLRKNYLFKKIIPFYIYNENNCGNECVICLQNFVINYSKICITPCNHIFHFYCLKKFILSTKNLECPLCKNNFFAYINKIKDKDLKKINIVPLDENDNPENEIKMTETLILNINKFNDKSNNNISIKIKSIQKTTMNSININDHMNTEVIKLNSIDENRETSENRNNKNREIVTFEQNDDSTKNYLRN